ncbi:MAG: hypothetical protein IKE94_06655 [Aeriscardovia sp.]|nr:hypothetical protein [Aeriscardovia sp.]
MTTLCDVIDNCTECPRYGDDCDGSAERLYTHEEAWGMCDLISRADAIERIANDNVVGGMKRINEYRDSTEHNDYLDGISTAIATIE